MESGSEYIYIYIYLYQHACKTLKRKSMREPRASQRVRSISILQPPHLVLLLGSSNFIFGELDAALPLLSLFSASAAGGDRAWREQQSAKNQG